MAAPKSPQAFARLAMALRRELEQVEKVSSEAEQALADFPGGHTAPPLRELRGIGDVVHDFYTGIERAFEKIAQEFDGGLPAGPSWHRELLENMTLELPGIRPAVLRRETAHALDEFLRFRHLFRNLYGFELEWPRLRALLAQVAGVSRNVHADIEAFAAFLLAVSSGAR